MGRWTNIAEKTAEERGYIIASWYDTKDEVNHILSQLHACGIRAMKAHHKESRYNNYDFWALWVKKEDLHKMSPNYIPPAKKEKPKKVSRGGRRKDMALCVIRMRNNGMEWEDIAKELGRSVTTVKDYFYRYKCKTPLTDWVDDRRPEGYDPETGLIKSRTSENSDGGES